MYIAAGGNAEKIIPAANHVLLLDSAYARRAENARAQFF